LIQRRIWLSLDIQVEARARARRRDGSPIDGGEPPRRRNVKREQPDYCSRLE
jgi:hypothetical protein